MDGTSVLKEVVGWCSPKLRLPERIHAQKLRQYLATTCQVCIYLNFVVTFNLIFHLSRNLMFHLSFCNLECHGKLAVTFHSVS